MISRSRIRSAALRLSAFLRRLALVAMPFGLGGDAQATLTASANHDHIRIDFTYRGGTVGVKGESDPGTDIVVVIAAPEGHQRMMKKGKVGGLVWMNVGALEFQGTPNLYEVFSTRSLDEVLSPEERAANVIGYDALLRHVTIEPTGNDAEKATWFAELVKMKERSRLYLVSPGSVETHALPDGRQHYEVRTTWPYQAPPGAYAVTVFAVKGGKVVERAGCTVHVEQVGMVKALASMARERAALYGIVSIVIAIGAGFGVGLVVKKGGAH